MKKIKVTINQMELMRICSRERFKWLKQKLMKAGIPLKETGRIHPKYGQIIKQEDYRDYSITYVWTGY